MLPLPLATRCVIALAWLSAPVAALEWRIVSVNDAPALDGGVVSFLEGGAFSGTSGCNRFQGNATVEAGELVVTGPVATTRMACAGEALTRQDDAIIALFRGRIGVSFDPLRAVMTLRNQAASAVLKPAPQSGPAIPRTHGGLDRPAGDPPYLAAFGITGQLDIRSDASAGAEVLGAGDPGAILRNSGCSEVAGGRWCQVALADGSLSGWASADMLEPAGSDLRAGQGIFDAVGLIACAKGIGAPMTQCAFGVARDGDGNATVVVDRTDGLTRALFFTGEALLGADTSEADGGHEVSVTREGDLFLIRVNNERYEIPDAVIQGG